MKLNVAIPTPTLVVVSNDRPHQSPLAQDKDPAAFRLGFVEEFLRSRELSANSKIALSKLVRSTMLLEELSQL